MKNFIFPLVCLVVFILVSGVFEKIESRFEATGNIPVIIEIVGFVLLIIFIVIVTVGGKILGIDFSLA